VKKKKTKRRLAIAMIVVKDRVIGQRHRSRPFAKVAAMAAATRRGHKL
jgi:hypothetical protein